ncbi:MAG TPA: pirin family protein, partial [Chitinophagales bacterium]
MANRTIKSLEGGRTINVGSIGVQELLPNKNGFFDPFLVFHHGYNKVNPEIPVKQQGVGPHPHRGFSPITFVYKGGVQHRDSRGNEQTVYAGGTQWMNVGMGMVHSERVPDDIFEHGGEQEILQVWVNTPAKFKMNQPEYFPLTKEETPSVTSADGLVQLLVPAGKLENVQGKIPTMSPVTTIMGEAKKNGFYAF